MKLLTEPKCTREMIEIKEPAHTEVRFNLLGLLGIVPIITSRDVEEVVTGYIPGRSVWNRPEVDFEDDDAMDVCVVDDGYGGLRKRGEPQVLMFEGNQHVYVLYGLFPVECLRDNVWTCSIDYAVF